MMRKSRLFFLSNDVRIYPSFFFPVAASMAFCSAENRLDIAASGFPKEGHSLLGVRVSSILLGSSRRQQQATTSQRDEKDKRCCFLTRARASLTQLFPTLWPATHRPASELTTLPYDRHYISQLSGSQVLGRVSPTWPLCAYSSCFENFFWKMLVLWLKRISYTDRFFLLLYLTGNWLENKTGKVDLRISSLDTIIIQTVDSTLGKLYFIYDKISI